jgi:DNA-binding XRE family transcriptional regulator
MIELGMEQETLGKHLHLEQKIPNLLETEDFNEK